MRGIENLGNWAVRFLKIALVAEVLFLLHSIAFLIYLNGIEAGNWTGAEIDRYADMIDISGGIVSIGYIVVLLACYIVCGRWIYRASFNASVIGANAPGRISPGWSVGWYFIPVMNLFKPFQAMRQIWNSTFKPGQDINSPAESALTWWWAGWIISNIIGQISYRMATGSGNEGLRAATIADFINFPIAIVAIYFFMRIIQAVTKGQSDDKIHETFA